MNAQALGELRSPLVWLVLGLVIERPSHGYEIARRYEDRFGSFLPISGSSVYASLDRLHGAGMLEEIAVEDDEEADARSRGRRRYRATRAGVGAYRDWVAARMRDDPQRAQLLARLASASVLGVGGALDVLERFERDCLQEMKALPLCEDDPVREGRVRFTELAQWLVVSWQRTQLRAALDWAADARRMLLAYAERGERAPEHG